MLFILLLSHSLVSLFLTLTPAFINPKKTPDFSITSRAFRFLLASYCSSLIPKRNTHVECVSEEAALALLMIESCFQFMPSLWQEFFLPIMIYYLQYFVKEYCTQKLCNQEAIKCNMKNWSNIVALEGDTKSPVSGK